MVDQITTFDKGAIKAFYHFARESWSLELLSYNQSSVQRRLHQILDRLHLCDLNALRQYYQGRPQGRKDFINHFTVPVTELFREPEFWQALQRDVFPMWQDRAEINILHVGCSTGEEVLSLSILASQADLQARLNITATDINSEALNHLLKPSIARDKMLLARANYLAAGGKGSLDDYCLFNSNRVFFNSHLIDRVKLQTLDIVNEKIDTRFDLVLCRNTLIYFNGPWQKIVIQNLLDHLHIGGILAIGNHESLIFFMPYLEYLRKISAEANLYRKL